MESASNPVSSTTRSAPLPVVVIFTSAGNSATLSTTNVPDSTTISALPEKPLKTSGESKYPLPASLKAISPSPTIVALPLPQNEASIKSSELPASTFITVSSSSRRNCPEKLFLTFPAETISTPPVIAVVSLAVKVAPCTRVIFGATCSGEIKDLEPIPYFHDIVASNFKSKLTPK